MSWKDAAQLESQLKHALDAFEWQGAALICNEIIDRIKKSSEQIPEKTARLLLARLRRKRRFTLMRPACGGNHCVRRDHSSKCGASMRRH